MNSRPTASWSEKAPERLEDRLDIQSDGIIVVRSGKVEYGQGIRTGFANIVAEELDVPLERVRVVLGETDQVPWDMGTFGSLSTATDGKSLRMAAAFARQLLLERAARQFDVPVSELVTQEGQVCTRDGRSVAYEVLAATEPLYGLIPESTSNQPAKAPVVDSPLRLEAHAIVTGRACYAADVRLPGMLRGHVRHPPRPESRLLSFNDSTARAMPGVVAVVQEGDFIGIVAERDEQAQAAADALEVQWALPPTAGTIPLYDGLLRDDDDVDVAFKDAARRFDARYHLPHISHAPISPSAAVADVRNDGVDLYAATQRPFGLRDEVAAMLDMAPQQVHVHPQMMGGMFGRGNMHDAPLDAVRLSRAVSRPVLVQWTRTEEFRLSPQRPILDAEVSATLDNEGMIAAWNYHQRTNPHTYGMGAMPAYVIEMTSGRNAVPPYHLGRARVRLQVLPTPVRTGAFRSLAAAQNTFAIESFIDELAHASGQDSIMFRLRHIDDPRLKRVLETVAQRCGWTKRSREAGRGFGVACAIYHGTYVAEVVEVVVDASGRVGIEQVWCAVDAGRVVHPDGARNQIQGGVQQTASWTLLEELKQDGGVVTTTSFEDYTIATMHDAPKAIDVAFVGEPAVASTGVGEPGSVPTAAAIANAVFEACGARIRRLPITPAVLSAARGSGTSNG
jgi:nicotinate dehydrogenase subunit B